MDGLATFGARRHLVANADVREGAPHHHFVIAAARAERVEVDRPHLVHLQILARGPVFLDRSGRRDVVGRHAVRQDSQRPRADHVRHAARFRRHILEKAGMADIGRAIVPLVGQAGRGLDVLPRLVAGEDIVVALAEHLGRQDRVENLLYLAIGRPDVLEEDIVAVGVLPDRIVVDVHQHGAGEGIGNDQWRRGQVVELGQRMHPALEVTVAGQNCANADIAVDDGLVYLGL